MESKIRGDGCASFILVGAVEVEAILILRCAETPNCKFASTTVYSVRAHGIFRSSPAPQCRTLSDLTLLERPDLKHQLDLMILYQHFVVTER